MSRKRNLQEMENAVTRGAAPAGLYADYAV